MKATVLPQRKRLILSFGDVGLTASIFEDAEIDVDDYEQNCESNDATLVAVKASADTVNEPIAKLIRYLIFLSFFSIIPATENMSFQILSILIEVGKAGFCRKR